MSNPRPLDPISQSPEGPDVIAVSGRVASACFGDLSSGLALGSSFTTAIFEIEGLFELERLMEELAPRPSSACSRSE